MEDTLLYIDSEPATRLLVRRVLGSAGFRVLEAESLDSGRELAEHSRQEIVLLDVDDATAPAGLLPTFRKSPGMERSVFLASTADDRPARTEDLVACGFQGVLVKPLDIDTLANELKPYLSREPPWPNPPSRSTPSRRPASASGRAGGSTSARSWSGSFAALTQPTAC